MTHNHTDLVVGVDGGGSQTKAVAVRPDGQPLGRGLAGPSNCQHEPLETVRANLLAAMAQALAAAGASFEDVVAVTLALAGADRAADQDRIRQALAGVFPRASIAIVHDAAAALIGGLGGHRGLVTICGTGMIVYGEGGAGRSVRAGGWGYHLDRGSGYSIGLAALRAVTQAADGLLSTRLSDSLPLALGLADARQIVPWLYDPTRPVAKVAALAPLVIAAAEQGDLAAMEILAQAADEICAAVGIVAGQLSVGGEVLPLVLAGALVTRSDYFQGLLRQTLAARLRTVRLVAPRYDAARGAALLALEAAGLWTSTVVNVPGEADAAWPTEWSNELTRDLDRWTARAIVGVMHLEDARAVAAIRPCLDVIAAAVDAIVERLRAGGRLIYVGAGTSGRLAALDAAECAPTFGAEPGQVVAVVAGGERAMGQALEDVEDDSAAGQDAMARLGMSERDAVVGISASGRTPYVVAALGAAQQRGALTLALVSNQPSALDDLVRYVIAPIAGPEVVTGSTRLKAGTTHKLILNMLSTASFVRLGRVYGNLMISAAPTNAKLRARLVRTVASAGEVDEPQAEGALREADGDARVAILSLRLGCSAADARARLAQHQGDLRAASGRA